MPEPVGGGITNANFLVDDGQRRCFVRIGDDIPGPPHPALARAGGESRRPCRRHFAGRAPCRAGRARPRSGRGPHLRPRGRPRAPQSRAHRAPAAPCPSRVAALSARTDAGVLGLPRPARLCGRPRRGASSARGRPARPARSRRAPGAGSGTDRAGLRPQRPARRQPDRRRRRASGWSTGTMAAGTVLCSTWAASRRTASCRRRTGSGCSKPISSGPLDDELRHRAHAMLTASLLREAMWSMVSEVHSGLDFDFVAYTAENLARFERAWAEFDRHGARMTDLPTSARVVIVGGGIVGCSVAYHLGKLGWTDVRPPRAGPADLGLDLARRGAGRPAAHQRQHHPAARATRSSSTTGWRPRPARRRGGSAMAACAWPAPPTAGPRCAAKRPRRIPSAWTCTCCRRARRRSCGRR